jgi:hypothetical protein
VSLFAFTLVAQLAAGAAPTVRPVAPVLAFPEAGLDDSVAVLVAGTDQLDQWLMAHPVEVFTRPPEQAVVNPGNPSVLDPQLGCAAYEQPLVHGDEVFWGEQLEQGVRRLVLDDHLRLRDGRAYWHGIPIDYPEYPHTQAREARVYLRPHELDITRTNGLEIAGNGSLQASVLRIARSGAISRISCRPDNSESELHVDLPADTARDLALQTGERVAITPRKVRVFLPDPEYVI